MLSVGLDAVGYEALPGGFPTLLSGLLRLRLPWRPTFSGLVAFSRARVGFGQRGPGSSEKKRRFRFRGQVAFASYFHARDSFTGVLGEGHLPEGRMRQH